MVLKLYVRFYNKELKSVLQSKILNLLRFRYEENIAVDFLEANQYWKYQDLTICKFALFPKEQVNFKELLEVFGVQYDYTCERRESADESAIWSDHGHGGVFIDENVEWAHIYTWDDSIQGYVPNK